MYSAQGIFQQYFQCLKVHTLLNKIGKLQKHNKICISAGPGNTKGDSIPVPLTSCLTGLVSAIWQLTIFVFICKKDKAKPIKQEINGIVILPHLGFPGRSNGLFCLSLYQSHLILQLSVQLLVCLSVPSSVCRCFCLSVCPFVCLSVFLCPSIILSVCMLVCLFKTNVKTFYCCKWNSISVLERSSLQNKWINCLQNFFLRLTPDC